VFAGKQTDPIIGVDLHMEMVPTPAPVPTPFPMPFVGAIEFSPVGVLLQWGIVTALSAVFDVPPEGPVLVNMLEAAKTGDEGKNHSLLPHTVIPPGTMWTPLPKPLKLKMRPGSPPKADNPAAPPGDAILVTGSDSVYISGNPASRLGDLAMSCGDPVRLPSSSLLAVPRGNPVLIGGAPKLDYAAAAKAFLLRNKWTAGLLHQLSSLLPRGRLRSLFRALTCFMTGHPVDVATGRMMTYPVDFELPGPIPLKFERVYSSAWCERSSDIGYGWSHTLDERIWLERGKVVYKEGEGRELEFDTFDFPGRRMSAGKEAWHAVDQLTLRCLGEGHWQVRSKDGLTREFALVGGDTRVSRLLAIRDRVGNSIRLEYGSRGELEWVTDSAGRRLRFVHDARGRLHRIALPAPTWDGWFDAMTYEYSEEGDLVGAKDANGKWTRYEYVRHLMVQETDRDGLSFYFLYDGDDATASCVRTWGDAGIYDHAIVYDRKNQRTFVTNSLGHTTIYAMNAANAVIAVTDPHGEKTRYEYTDTLWKSAEIGPLGDATRWTHDARGNVTQVVLPNGAASTVVYDAHDQPIAARDVAGVDWAWRYDELGRLAVRETTAGEVLRVTYDGRLPRVVLVDLDRYELRHDEHANLTHLTRPDGATSITKFDHLGRARGWRDVAGNLTELERDLTGNVLRMTSPDGTVRAAEYSGEGHVTRLFNGYTQVSFEYAGFHQLAGRTIAGDTVRWKHDTEGQLVLVTNENGEDYRFVRDARGDVAEEIGFDGRKHLFSRDAGARVTTVLKPSKADQKISYDVMGNVTEIRYSADGSKDTFTYSTTGRLLSATNGAGTAWFERDVRGRVLREGFGDDWVRSEYDARHCRVGVTTSRGLEQRIERDVLGGVRSVSVPAAGWKVEFERNVFGQEVSRTLPGGVYARWERDPEGRPLAQHIAQNGKWTRSTRYKWDGPERIAEIDDSVDGLTRYEHDARSRLIGAEYVKRGERQNRRMDPAGNIYKRDDRSDRRYGKGGVLLEAEGTRYGYDGDGNLILKELPNGERWEYRWNGAGRLEEVGRPDGGRVRFEYDALARRVGKTVDPCDAGPAEEHGWLWDRNVPVHVRGGLAIATWTFDPGMHSPLASHGDGGTLSAVADQLGAVRALYDDEGRLSARSNVDAFGASQTTDGPSRVPWSWPGQYPDVHAECSYNRYRYYDPGAGHYLSQDPLRAAGDLSLYGYVEDPLIGTDTFGLAQIFDVGTYGSLTGAEHVGDKLQAHELLRHLWLRTLGIASSGRLAENPAIALPDAIHATVHAEEAAIRASMGLGPKQFSGSLESELNIVATAMRRAGVPQDRIDKLKRDARRFGKQKGCPK
jgi:RHS repeat-associated protein